MVTVGKIGDLRRYLRDKVTPKQRVKASEVGTRINRRQDVFGLHSLQPQRTNNLIERFFRDWRRGARRRMGRNSISRWLQSMIADTPLVRNLENPRHLKILLNGQATLEDRFAQIDVATVRKELQAAQISLEKVPPKIRQLIAAPTFPETICRLLQKAA